MSELERLGWVAERAFDVHGFQFAVRSTDNQFVISVAKHLAQFEYDALVPVWPIYSVVAPRPRTYSNHNRSFFVGYVDGREIFRYSDPQAATQALYGALDSRGRGGWVADQFLLKADVLAVGNNRSGLLLYGPRSSDLIDALRGGRQFSKGSCLMSVTGCVLGWPFSTVSRPEQRDRRGVTLAPLGDLVAEAMDGPIVIKAIVRSGSGTASDGQVVAELMRHTRCSADRTVAFRGLTAMVRQSIIVEANAACSAKVAEMLLRAAGC